MEITNHDNSLWLNIKTIFNYWFNTENLIEMCKKIKESSQLIEDEKKMLTAIIKERLSSLMGAKYRYEKVFKHISKEEVKNHLQLQIKSKEIHAMMDYLKSIFNEWNNA